MAAHGRGSDRSLTQLLFDETYRFDFYQAVRLIEMLYPKKAALGEDYGIEKECVRFTSNVRLDFPASAVSEIIPADADKPLEMAVNFMGLAGCLGPLPIPYSELILERESKKDTAFKAFLDIFNHRLISLMYQVRKAYRIGFDFKPPHQTSFARYFFSLMGLGTSGLQDRMKIKDRALLGYTSILAQQPRSISGLEYILADYFDVKVKARQLCGQWYRIEEDQITRIGVTGQNQILGDSAVVGSRVWNQQGKFELHVGPVSMKQFHEFLPDGQAFEPLCQLTRYYAGTEFEFDIVLILQKEDDPSHLPRIGGAEGFRLGWSSWLCSGKAPSALSPVRLSSRLFSTGQQQEASQ
ncbi:MAG: type VI secretion system baseplate subunit TssG [Desulfobacterales bacterium]|nr:type VI secretion system baseplate subunit TssG [Desulfobacterales bacterium]MDD4073787.1 type VI secretion system baseplate subunit TssG [Desulfobacterales bacterium]MDD4393783.1 type VI secretion system baseplate subunit TssG [Desulfobacterales bacterium]